jgi:uncharacterized protein YutD|tara:strand:+ start:1191 stop:1751 length:561 start_codon:yes stop_codon:yes gene_type:complete
MESTMKKRTTLKRIISNFSWGLNRYSLLANSNLYISLPNGDTLRLYASEDGKYASIDINTHRQIGCLETYSEGHDFDDFTVQNESISAFDTRIGDLGWTKVKFRAFHDKETEEDSRFTNEQELKDMLDDRVGYENEFVWTDELVAEFALESTHGSHGLYSGCKTRQEKLDRFKDLRTSEFIPDDKD